MKKLKVIFCLLLLTVVISLINNTVEARSEFDAEITSSEIIQVKTGTGPWDENDEPGNDTSDENNIVRSFDQVTWTVENTLGLVGTAGTSLKGGKMHFEVSLPNTAFSSETAAWDLESMAWIENATLSSDKMTLSGYYQLNENEVTIPGKQSLVFVAKIFGARNGTTFKPSFKFWLEKGENWEEYESYDTIEKTGDDIVVSAAPRYNLVLKRNTTWGTERAEVDFGEGSIQGRMYGYYLILQLYNDSQSKGMRGLEYPTGNITFDVYPKMYKSNFGEENTIDITEEADLRLWNYKVTAGGNNNGVIPNRKFIGNYNPGYGNGIYLAPGGRRGATLTSVFNSGSINMQEDENVIHVTVNNYKFDGVFPNYNTSHDPSVATNPDYKENIGCFGSYYFQIFIPDNEATEEGNKNYYLELTDDNFNATSLSGINITNQMSESDDKDRVTHVRYRPGSYEQDMWCYDINNRPLHTFHDYADGFVTRGQEMIVHVGVRITPTNETIVNTVDKFFKFDGTDVEPLLKNGNYYELSDGLKTMNFKMWFVTKPDGTNWADERERNNALIENMNKYENIEDVPEGYYIVGEFFESQNGPINNPTGYGSIYIKTFLKVREDVPIGKTLGFTQSSRYWLDELDRSIYSQEVVNGFSTYPTPIRTILNRNYIQAQYNEDGIVIPGTHTGGYLWGATVLVVGARQEIGITTVTDIDSDVSKVNYDLGKNENEIIYKLTPALKQYDESKPQDISNVSIRVKSTLPVGLRYKPNSSNYGEPEIIINNDGTTTLVWEINGCTVGEQIEPVYYTALINEETSNGVQYTTSAVISADESTIGNTQLDLRTTTTSIQVINLSSHRLYKIDSTPIIEVDGTIHFTLSYKNNTEDSIPDFQLLDILPYNEDGRGTGFTGTYTIDRIELTQEDSQGNNISNPNIKVYYSNDDSSRSANSKDVNLAEGWTEATNGSTSFDAKAIVVKGRVEGQEKVNLDIYLKTQDNKGLDKYVNSASCQVYAATEEMVTSNVTTQVVLRTIEGIAWYDVNANGLKDSNEDIAKNVSISLINASGEQVTDVNGNLVVPIQTNDDGYYKFTDLPMDNYYVRVAMPNGTYMLTEKEVGANTTINSKFNVETNETDEITKLNTLDLPELTQSNVNAGFVKKPTKVVVNYLEKGTTTKLLPEYTIDGRIDDEYSTTNRIAEVNAANENKYNYDSVDGEVSGTMIEDTIYITYYYVKKDTQVKVLHVEEGTDVSDPESVTDVLYPTETINGKVDDRYNTSNRLTEINNTHTEQYDFVRSTDNTTGTMTVDTIYVIYEYKKIPASIKVQHLEKGTNAVLNPEETKDGIVGESYTTTDKLADINATFGDKYELVTPEPANKNGTYTREEQTVTYYYQKKESRVVIIHVDSETVITDPETVTDVLYPTEEKTGRVDDLYNSVERTNEINATSNYKYALDHVVGNANGNFAVDTIYVIYVYAKQDTVLYIKHVDVVTGEELDSITVEGYIGDIVNTREGTFPSYRLYEKPATEEYTLTEDPITVTYYYIRQANVITKYVDEVTGNEISIQNFDTYDQNSDYTTVKKDIPEYTYTRDTENTTGTIGIDDVFVTYYYKKNTSLLVRYIDYYTEEEISPSVTMNGVEEQDYTTEQKEIENYVYVDVIGTPAGQMAREPQEIIYRYKKQANLITEHIDANTGEKIIPDVTKKYMEKEEYEAYGQNIPGYVLVQEPESKTGIMGREDVTKTFYYKKISGGLIVKYVDVLTGELLDQEVYEGTEGEHIDFDKKHFLYYVLHSTPEVESANLTVEPQEYIYYYIRLGKVPVKGIVQGTGEELYTYELSGIEGDPYQATPRNVEGYELVVIPDNERGTYERNTREVVYEYRKIEEEKHGDVIVKYITEDGEELSRETDNGLVGETFHFEEKTFEGYEVISRPDSLDGEYIEGTIELVFVLRPVEPEIVEGTIIVKFVDKNGNVLRQQVVSKDLVGEDYYLEAPEIDGYHVVGEDKVRATYVDGELVFEIVYDKDEEIPADPDPHEDPAPTPTPEPEPQPQPEEPKTVDTSDMNMALVLVIAIASISGITLVKKYIKD